MVINMYEIEKNIPIPKPKRYPWDDMSVGDSFLITNVELSTGVYTSFQRWQTKKPSRNTLDIIRRVVNDGYRVWLVERNTVPKLHEG